MDTGLLRWQPFTIWGGPRMSLGGVPCAPLPPMTLLSRGIVAWIQKRIFLGRPYAMGFNWQPCTLPSSMGGILDLCHLHPRAAPLFRCFGILMGGLHSPPLLLLVIVGGCVRWWDLSPGPWGVSSCGYIGCPEPGICGLVASPFFAAGGSHRFHRLLWGSFKIMVLLS
jgi:hypothetical protein